MNFLDMSTASYNLEFSCLMFPIPVCRGICVHMSHLCNNSSLELISEPAFMSKFRTMQQKTLTMDPVFSWRKHQASFGAPAAVTSKIWPDRGSSMKALSKQGEIPKNHHFNEKNDVNLLQKPNGSKW